jgi:hypothetical protein
MTLELKLTKKEAFAPDVQEPPFWYVAPDQIPDILTYSDKKQINLWGKDTNLNLSISTETKAADIEGRVNEDCPFITPMGEGRLLVAVLDGASS